jgi:CRP-like cAMP-binding protein
LARQLLTLGDYAGVRVDGRIRLEPRPTHQTLADMLGIRRETATLALLQLRELRAVEIGRHHLDLLPQRLRMVLRPEARPSTVPAAAV